MSKRSQLKRKKRKHSLKKAKAQLPRERPVCGLCGAEENLTRTECCSQWICDDEDQYQLFSFARNSCYRNHRRQTLCGFHHTESHKGDWTTCLKCRTNFEDDLERYVYHGTNEYNFKVLPNPPKYEPTRCISCDVVIDKSMGGYSEGPDGARCMECTTKAFGKI